MPYYGDHFDGDPGLFGKIFKGIGRAVKKIRLGSIIGQAVLPGLGFRPSSPAKGVVSKVAEVRAVTGTGPAGAIKTVGVAAPLAARARKRKATFRVVGGRVKAESSFARRRRLGLI
jgi:hypothetical protein